MNKKSRLFIIFLVSVGLLVFIPSSIPDNVAGAGENWLTGWSYRKTHTIQSASGAGTGYQVKVITQYSGSVEANYSSQTIHLEGYANAWDSDNNSYIVVKIGSDYELYKSVDEGRTYFQVWNSPASGTLYHYFIFISSSDRIFVNTLNELSGDPKKFYYSDDGLSFNQIVDADVTNMNFWYMTEDASNNLYVSRYEGPGNYAGLFKSTDDGISWTNISDSTWDDSYVSGNRHVHHIKYDSSSGWLYATLGDDATVDGIWRSKLMDGSDWIRKNTTQCIGIDFKDSYAYFSSDTGNSRIFRFIDDGTGSTQTMETLIDWGAIGAGYYVEKDNSDRLWVGIYNYGLWTSDDGENWTRRENSASPSDSYMQGSRNFPSINGEDIFYTHSYVDNAIRSTFDTNIVVSLQGNAQTDFDDVRFTNSTGSDLLDHWRQEYVDSDYAVFWVEIAGDLSSGNQIIYIYYGNVSASTASDGYETFPLVYDHFDNEVIDDPPWVASASATETGTNVTIGDASNDWDNITSEGMSAGIALVSLLNRNWSATNTNTSEGIHLWNSATNQMGYGSLNFVYLTRMRVDGYWAVEQKIEADYGLAYHIHELYWTSNGTWWLLDYSGKMASSYYPNTNNMLALIQSYYTDNYLISNWTFVRKYVYPEPAHSIWGSQEYPNDPPDDPSIDSGPSSGYVDVWYAYTISCSGDSDGDDVKFSMNWDDGTWNVSALMPQAGASATFYHNWSSPGVYNITAFVEDEHGLNATNNDSMLVTITIYVPPTPPTPSETGYSIYFIVLIILFIFLFIIGLLIPSGICLIFSGICAILLGLLMLEQFLSILEQIISYAVSGIGLFTITIGGIVGYEHGV